ncbi:TVA3 protein, partial [Polypterus senegalus]
MRKEQRSPAQKLYPSSHMLWNAPQTTACQIKQLIKHILTHFGLCCSPNPAVSHVDYSFALHASNVFDGNNTSFNVIEIPASGLIISDSVTNTEKEVSSAEGLAVTLNCSYSTTDSYPVLNWYRRYPNHAMQFILYKGARSSRDDYKAEFARGRFSSTTGQYSTKLQISALSLSDSAIYYCALRPTVLYSAQALNKI